MPTANVGALRFVGDKGSSARAAARRRVAQGDLAGLLGQPKAITATARKLAVMVYRVLRGDIVYRDPGAATHLQLHRTRLIYQSSPSRPRTWSQPDQSRKRRSARPCARAINSFLGAKWRDRAPSSGRIPIVSMEREFYVYILGSRSGVLYIGVTSDLERRI